MLAMQVCACVYPVSRAFSASDGCGIHQSLSGRAEGTESGAAHKNHQKTDAVEAIAIARAHPAKQASKSSHRQPLIVDPTHRCSRAFEEGARSRVGWRMRVCDWALALCSSRPYRLRPLLLRFAFLFRPFSRTLNKASATQPSQPSFLLISLHHTLSCLCRRLALLLLLLLTTAFLSPPVNCL
ncbi:hypothetical protein GQ54DRAFT_112540 [Martensiomyces pterosporus]|nr:hypothetical protein GQ54DRAFT_112540 [Martensiomyces pterosporus]